MKDFDYYEDQEETPENILQHLSYLAAKYDRLSKEYKEAEKKEKTVKEELRRLKEEEIPALMDRAGMEKCVTREGREVSISSKPVANIPSPTTSDPLLAEKRVRVLRWLKESGYGRLLKREMRVEFSQEQEAEAQALSDELADKGLSALDYSTVHHSTYSKFLKECLADGVDLPDFLDVHVIRQAKVK